jgi:hypothetical protein
MARRKKLGHVEGLQQDVVRYGPWVLDDDDFWLAALLTDSVYAAEVLWPDPTNHEFGGCYRVRDYQYEFDRPKSNYEGFACARTVGKTESIKRKFLDYRGGKTGFTHRPFGVDFIDGTKIVGRIPRLTGTGVKGQHQPDLIVDEAQDYPERGWVEVHETVMKDHIDYAGNPDFYYCFYGVHSGARETGFYKRVQAGAFRVVQVTALQRPGWGKSEKEAAKAAYGGTSSPDYRRNILGEAGSAASQFFVISRLVACMDQDRESDYNTVEYRHQDLRAEEVIELQMPMLDVLDLPSGYGKVWGGMDVGLTDSPTVIMLFAEARDRKKRERLKLIRRITMERFRTRMIRESLYAVDNTYGSSLQGFGMDVTGLGFPMWQEMEDDEALPTHLRTVARGYFFNAKVPVQVDKQYISEDTAGRMRDQYGSAVKKEEDPLTGIVRYVTEMTMLEASTRYLREWVDSGHLWLPFDTAISTDFLGETQQRVKRTGELRRKPNAFHILDAARAMAMVRRAGDIESALAPDRQVAVLDYAVEA